MCSFLLFLGTTSHNSTSEDLLASIEVTEEADAEALKEFLCEEPASGEKADAVKSDPIELREEA